MQHDVEQWIHLYKARAHTRSRIESLHKVNMESKYRDELYFSRKTQIEHLSKLLDQQECGMEDIMENRLSNDEQSEATMFALSFDPKNKGAA